MALLNSTILLKRDGAPFRRKGAGPMQLTYLKIILCITVLTLSLASPLFGFGKNKVQYTDFSWSYLPAAHFTLYFHQQQGNLPVLSYRMADDVYRTLSQRFRFTHRTPVPVVVYGDPNLFTQTNI